MKKKKLIKWLLVAFVMVNYLIQTPLMVKATYQWRPWYTKYTLQDGTIFDNDFVGNPETVSWGQDLRTPVSPVTEYRFGISIGQVAPGQTVKVNIDIDVSGIKPIQWELKTTIRDVNYREIVLDTPNIMVNTSGYNFYISGELEYTNNTTTNMYLLYFDWIFIESQSLTYSQTNVNALAVNVVPDLEDLQQDTNEKVGGILDTLNSVWTSITELPSNIASSIKGFFDNVVNSITNLGNFIIDGLKSLFIPTDEYFDNYFDDLYSFFSDKLGILLMPIEILTSLLNNILDLDNGDGYIHVPEFKFMNMTLIPKTDYNVKEAVSETLGTYYDMYYLLVDVIIYFMLFNMAKKKFEQVVGGAGSDS